MGKLFAAAQSPERLFYQLLAAVLFADRDNPLRPIRQHELLTTAPDPGVSVPHGRQRGDPAGVSGFTDNAQYDLLPRWGWPMLCNSIALHSEDEGPAQKRCRAGMAAGRPHAQVGEESVSAGRHGECARAVEAVPIK